MTHRELPAAPPAETTAPAAAASPAPAAPDAEARPAARPREEFTEGDGRRAARSLTSCLLVLVLLYQPVLALAGSPTTGRTGPARSQTSAGPAAVAAVSAFAASVGGALAYVSSIFAAAPPANDPGEPAAPPVAAPTPDNSLRDAAISKGTPQINAGRIEGGFRIFEGKNIALNNGTVLDGELYVVGTPKLIRTGNDSSYAGTVEEGGAAAPDDYQIHLNAGTRVTGKIHTRADAVALPSDIPSSVPAPTGARVVNVDDAASAANVGDWATLLDLNVTAPSVSIDVPPGNYRSFSVSAGSRLNFTAGTYNFSGTLQVNNGGSVQSTGRVTVNVAQDFTVAPGTLALGGATLPGDVRFNVLGSALTLDHGAQVSGLFRAPDARVHLKSNSLVRGQVVAGVLHMNDSRIVGDVRLTDDAPPSLAITSPSDNSSTQAETVTVTGTASDEGDPPTGVAQVSVNGRPAALDARTGAWTISGVALVIGANTITASAVDGGGNETRRAVTVTRQPPPDVQPPQVSVTSPAPNSETTEASAAFSGTASDHGQHQSGVARVYVNGAEAAFDASAGTWSHAAVALSVGANTVTVSAVDNAGNQSSATVNVTRRPPADTAPPALSITSPADGSTTEAESVTVSGTVTDPEPYPSGVAGVNVNGVAAAVGAGGAWSLDGLMLSVGANTITVTASDRAGNTTRATVTVTRRPPPDTQAPSLSVSTPFDNATTADETVTVTGTASDHGPHQSGVARVLVNERPAALDAQTGAWSLAGVALSVGPNVITVRAVDNAGNEAQQVLNVTRQPPADTRPPSLTITSPAAGATLPDETITVTGTAVDEGAYASGVRQVLVNGVEAAYDPATRVWSASGVALVEGANSIHVTAADAAPAPNIAEAALKITRRTPDRDAPVVAITSPHAQAETYGATINVTGTASDDGLNATGVRRVTVNGREAAYDAAGKRWTLTGLALDFGENVVTAVAFDGAEPPHEGRAEIRIMRLRIPPPTLAVTNPPNGGVYSSGVITVAGAVSSFSSDPLAVTVNGAPANVSGGHFTKTVTLAEGVNAINVVVTDSLGQQAQAALSVLKDASPPSVVFLDVPATVQPGGTYQIQAEAADDVGVAEVEFSVDGERVAAVLTAPYQFTLDVPTPLAAGSVINLSAVVRDLSGATAVAAAQTRTAGPGGVSGYVFDDATGYVLAGAAAMLDAAAVHADAEGAFNLVSTKPTGVVRLSKEGYTHVERSYAVTAGEGTALFDARLTPLDARANRVGPAGGAAAGDAGRLEVSFGPGLFETETDVRVTSVSPQGLANLLPYGWSPVPGAVVDVRAAGGGPQPGAFATPARLRIARTPYPTAGRALALVRYDERAHGWEVVALNLSSGPDGGLEADMPEPGQYAFLVADEGANAPPAPSVGQPLTSSRPADTSSLDAATAGAHASPRTAAYSSDARATISFVADAPAPLPSGVAAEASFDEKYNFLGGRDALLVGRPAQDFVLYAFPGAAADKPNRLGAFFVAKPTRTEFTVAELLGANVHVEIRSGRQPKTGLLVGPRGGTLTSGNGAQLLIPTDALDAAQPVFFADLTAEQAAARLPEGYEFIAAFEVNLTGATLARAASISVPSFAGDASRVVVARLLSVGGQRGPKVVARAAEAGGKLLSTVAPPHVPAGVTLPGVTAGGRYVFVRVPHDFGFAAGRTTDAGQPAALVKVSNDRTPFLDLTGADGRFVLVGDAASPGANQLGASATTTDATGRALATLGAQDAVAVSDIALSTAPLAVESVAPADGAQSVVATSPVTVTFNKPVAPQSVTNSSLRLTTAAGNPVLGRITVLAGSRVAVFTPSGTLPGSTSYRVAVARDVRDIYGKPLQAAFNSTFSTAAVVRPDDRLRPEKIRLGYPDAEGSSKLAVPPGSVPEGSTVIAVNEASGATVSTVAGTQGFELDVPAQVGDLITLIIRQPDGAEYRVSQAAYRRADGYTSVGSHGGALTSDDGRVVLSIPQGAVTGQAEIQLVPRAESDITTPRAGEMNPADVPFGAAVQVRARGHYKVEKEAHVELAVPAGADVQEGRRVAFMKPSKMNYEGEEIGVWEAVTSGKVEGGKFKTTSPPFRGFFLPPGASPDVVLGSIAIVELVVFVPIKLTAVHGLVTQSVPGGVARPLADVDCYLSPRLGEKPTVMVSTNGAGRFGTFGFGAYDGQVEVRAAFGGRIEHAVASPHINIDPQIFPGLIGLQTYFATVEFPPGTADAPAELQLAGLLPGEERDTLRELGVAPVGKTVRVVAANSPAVQDFKGTLRVNGADGPPLTWLPLPAQEGDPAGLQRRAADFVVSAEGSYSVEVETYRYRSRPATKARAAFNFVALRNPNSRPPLPGAPKVISVTPADRAARVDTGAKIHLEFSEPVRNLVAGSTLYVRDALTGAQLGGALTSGGIPVTADSANISSVDFVARGLAGGRQYEIHVTKAVVDSDRHPLDQDYTGEGDADQLEFVSTFKTFAGVVLTEGSPVADGSSRVAVAGQYAATIRTNNSSGSTLTVYDVSDPSRPAEAGTAFVPFRAVALAMAEVEEGGDAFRVGDPKAEYTRLAFVTAVSLPDTDRATNLWIYNLNDPSKPRVVGVVSLSFPNRVTAVPVALAVHKKRAYVGSVGYNGVSVVDIEKALALYARAEREATGSGARHPMTRAISPSVGFGAEAKVQTALHGPPPTGNPSHANSVSVIEQTVTSPGTEGRPVPMPVAYVASQFKPQLISFGLDASHDNQNGFADFRPRDGVEDRLLVNPAKAVVPAEPVIDVRAVADVQTPGGRADLALLLGATRLWVFNVENPAAPTQYTSRSFAELGAGAGFARRIEVEGSLAYVIFADRVCVFDLGDPEHVPLVATLEGVGANLGFLAVRDGFVYTLSAGGGTAQEGLNVSLARPASQVVAYGVNPSAPPESFCANPVVVDRATRRMAQPVGVFFQVFGRALPKAAQVLVRKEKSVAGQATEELLATLPATISDRSTQAVVVGRAQWAADAVIDPTAVYTAEVLIDGGSETEYRARREVIPFSTLISESQRAVGVRDGRSLYGYVLAGQAKVTLTVEGVNRLADAADPRPRAYGLNVEEVRVDLPPGTYPFTLRAELQGGGSVADEVFGEVSVSDEDEEVRLPGSTVVNGVELATGNLGLTYTDASVKNRGLSLSFTRSYNSAAAGTFGPLGYGWRHNYQALLVRHTEAGQYTMVGGDGGGFRFKEEKESGGRMEAEDPHQGTLVKNADGSFDFFTRERVRYHFPGALEQGGANFFNTGYMGNLEFMEEPNGNRLTLGYDGEGRMVSVTDSSGRALSFTYEQAETPFVGVLSTSLAGDISCTNKKQFGMVRGRFNRAEVGRAWRVTKVVGPGGLSLAYAYDDAGNLAAVTRSGEDGISTAASDRVWRYGYGPAAPPGTRADVRHLLKSVTAPNDRGGSHATAYGYHFDLFRTPVKSIDFPEGVTNGFAYTLGVDNKVTRAAVTDGRGQTTGYDFDPYGRPTLVVAPRGARTEMTWNAKGQKETERDPEGRLTTIRYERGNPVSQTVEGGGASVTESTTYDPQFNRPTSVTDGNNHTTTYTLDARGNVRRVGLPTGRSLTLDYAANGDLLTLVDEHGLTTTFAYDGRGNPTTVTREVSHGTRVTTSNTYDARSRLTSTSGTLEPSVTNAYDALDRVVESTATDPAGIRDPLTVRRTYLPAGQVKTEAHEGGAQRSEADFAYDGLDRLVTRTETASGADAYVLRYAYDANSNLLSETDRRGVTHAYTYDALNFRVSATVSGPFGAAVEVEKLAAVDLVGNPRSVVDMYGQTTALEYDGLHRLVKRTLPGGYTEETAYDANGNLTSSKDRKGRETATTYDAVNRPVEQRNPAGHVTRWTYDEAALAVTAQTFPQGLTSVTQTDLLGRPLRRQYKFGSASYTTAYAYDGRDVRVTDPRGVVTARTLSAFGEAGRVSVEGASPAWKTEAHYAAFGQAVSLTDANGRETAYTLDGLNRVTAVRHPGGFTEAYTYDGGGNVLTHTDRRGTVTAVTYDNLGRPLVTRVSNGAEQVTVATLAYDDAARAETLTDAAGRPTVTRYDGLGRPVSVTNAEGKTKALEYDGMNLLREGDFKGRFTAYRHDALDRVTEILDREGHAAVVDHLDRGGLTKTVTDRRGNRRVETYDALGRLVGVSAGGEALASFEYDGNDNQTARRDGRGGLTRYTYDALNRVTSADRASLQTETFGYDAAGNLVSHHDGAGAAVTQTFDELGRLKTRTDGAGNTTAYSFDGEGLLAEQTDAKQNKTSYRYNALGSLAGVTDARGGAWAFEYNVDQTLRRVTDALGRSVSYSYDPLRRLKSVTQPGGLVTTYDYDENGNRTSATDPNGQTASVAYDALDRAQAIRYEGARGAGPRRYEYGRDPEGNVTSVTETYSAGGTDTPSRTYARTYDARNRLGTATDPAGRRVAYAYDAADNVRSFTDAAGRQTSYDYDGLNRLRAATLPGGAAVGYAWRADGLLEKVEYPSGMERAYAYDAADRLTSVRNALGGATAEEFAYTYDRNSNRDTETKKFGGGVFRRASYTYDELDRLTRVAYGAEPGAEPGAGSGGGGPAGGLKGEYFDNPDFTAPKLTRTDAAIDFSWPALSSPDPSVDSESFSARWTGQIEPLYTETYTFHARTDEAVRVWVGGQLIIDRWEGHASTEHTGTCQLTAGRKVDLRVEFREDTGDAEARLMWSSPTQPRQVIPESRLSPPPAPGATQTALDYTYDAVGNRLSEAGTDIFGNAVSRAYSYDGLNRLTSAGDASYTYDPNGNLLTVSHGGAVTARYDYDARDQLRRAADGSGKEVARYDYDFERRRLSKAAAGVERGYVYDGDRLVNEYDSAGPLAGSFDHGSDLVRSTLAGEGERWHFSDALGSVTALSAVEGAAAGAATRYEYGAWGEITGGGGSSNQFAYTGQRLDPETGLMPLGNGERYYSPGLGRFTQQDSWAGKLDMPASLNRYAYSYDNPHKYVDPSGRIPIIIPALLGAMFMVTAATNYEEAETRRIEQGLTEEQVGYSWMHGLSDASGMTMVLNSYFGQDGYTARELSSTERVVQGGLGVLGVLGTATGFSGTMSTASKLGRAGVAEFRAAGGGLNGLRQLRAAGQRGLSRSLADELGGTRDELTQLKPFAQSRFGQGFAGTRLGGALELTDDALGRALAKSSVEGLRQAGSRLTSMRQGAQAAAAEAGSLKAAGPGSKAGATANVADEVSATEQRIRANVARSRAASGGSGFNKFDEAAANVDLTPKTLPEMEIRIRYDAATATLMARAANVPKSFGRFGTRAHKHFEDLMKQLDDQLKAAGNGFRVAAEEFRVAATGSSSNVVGRRASGSLGVDSVVYRNGVPVKGFDLKTGRSAWSKYKSAEIEKRFGVSVTELKTGR